MSVNNLLEQPTNSTQYNGSDGTTTINSGGEARIELERLPFVPCRHVENVGIIGDTGTGIGTTQVTKRVCTFMRDTTVDDIWVSADVVAFNLTDTITLEFHILDADKGRAEIGAATPFATAVLADADLPATIGTIIVNLGQVTETDRRALKGQSLWMGIVASGASSGDTFGDTSIAVSGREFRIA